MNARVVICSDGKRGHENQSRVVARMLGDSEPLLMLLRDNVKEGGAAEAMLRLRLRLGGGRAALSRAQAADAVRTWLQPEDNEAFREFAGRAQIQADADALFVVSTGTPPATFNLVLSRVLGARSIVNMTPSLLSRRLFDLCIVPEHDLRGSAPANTLSSPLALGYHDTQAAEHLVSRLCSLHGLRRDGRYIGLAIGGSSRHQTMSAQRVGAIVWEALRHCAANDCELLITTSRRTPREVCEFIHTLMNVDHSNFQQLVSSMLLISDGVSDELLTSESEEGVDLFLQNLRQYADRIVYFLDAGQSELNPLPAFYELCSALLISDDSFSMLSEAVQSGHQPVVFPASSSAPPAKLARAMGLLEERALIVRIVAPAQLSYALSGLAQRGSPNREYAQLAARLREKLGLAP